MAAGVTAARQSLPCTSLAFHLLRRRLIVSRFSRRMIQHSANIAQEETEQRLQTPATDSSQSALKSSPHRPRWPLLRPVFYTVAFLFLGLTSGGAFCSIVFPPALPEPGTQIDDYYLAWARKQVSDLPLTKELRDRRNEWLEYDAYMALSPEESAHSMTANLLQGSRAIAIQRVFWNKAEKRLINVLFLGGAMAGWPGILHGGGTATLLQENLERVARGPDFGSEPRRDYRLHDFTINYRKPANANHIYVIRAETDLSAKDQEEAKSRIRVKATLETASNGTVVAEVRGTCTRFQDEHTTGIAK